MNFGERISRGGILIFDEYGIPDWPGETAAVDEFVKPTDGPSAIYIRMDQCSRCLSGKVLAACR